jgi:hypothetical protein
MAERWSGSDRSRPTHTQARGCGGSSAMAVSIPATRRPPLPPRERGSGCPTASCSTPKRGRTAEKKRSCASIRTGPATRRSATKAPAQRFRFSPQRSQLGPRGRSWLPAQSTSPTPACMAIPRSRSSKPWSRGSPMTGAWIPASLRPAWPICTTSAASKASQGKSRKGSTAGSGSASAPGQKTMTPSSR